MKEKRKHPRVSVSVPVSYECYNDDGEMMENSMGIILDVSMGGVLIESSAIIDANYIKIVFISYENKELSIVGSIVHSGKTDTGVVKTGICFHGGKNETYDFVTSLVRTYHYRKNGYKIQ